MRIEDVILLNDWLYLLKPSFVIDIFTMVGLGGLVLSFAFSRNRTLAEIFAFSNIMLPVLLLLTPITVPVLARIIHLNLVFRIPHMMVIPNALLIGSLLSRGTASLQKSLSAKTAIFLSLLSLLMVSIFMVQTQTISMIKGVAKKLVQYRRYDEGFAIKGMYRYIRENLPDGSVIMSDPYLSYHIPAFARHFVVAPHNHPPYVKDRNERLYDTLYFFDPLTSTAEILPIIKKYHIGYILLNRSAIPEFPKKFLEASFFEKLHEDWIYPDLRQSSKDTPNAVFYKVKIGEKEMKETAERLSTLAMSYSLDGRPDKAWSLIKLVERLYPEKGHMLKIIEQKGKETFENLWREIGRGGQNISDLILRLCSLSMFDHEGRRHRLLVEMEREGLLRSFEMTIPGKESFPKVIKGIDYGATPPRIDTGLIWLHGSMNTLTFEFQGPVIINQLVLDVSISEKFYIIGGILRLGIDGEGYDVIGSFESIDSFDFGRHSIWLKDIDRTARFIRITIMGDSLSPIEVPRIYIKGYTF
ncbi:MAG: hypothetical protein HY731_14430 [Candidatus Tectomicrobia bacterium]|nr:hypothetical protein [Candidatus Tectomicrobia bacterium]